MKNQFIYAILMIASILGGIPSVSGQDNDEKKSKNHHRHTDSDFKFDIGMNNYLENGQFPDENGALYGVKPWGSWFVAMGTVYKSHIAGPLHVEWGGDVSWQNYKFINKSVNIISAPTGIEFIENTDATRISEKSKLTATFVNGSIVPLIRFGNKRKSLRAGAGLYGGYKIHSYSKYVYNFEGQTIKDRNNENYFINNLQYGLRLRFGYRDFDLFANYSFTSLFVEGKGPQLQPVSIGFTFH